MAVGSPLGFQQVVKSNSFPGWHEQPALFRAAYHQEGISTDQQVQLEHLKQAAPKIEMAGAYWPIMDQTRFNSFIVNVQARKPDFVFVSIAGTDNAQLEIKTPEGWRPEQEIRNAQQK